LGAHEVGHALGLSHNFAASSQGRRSVMDYPAPRVNLVNGKPDLSDAYGVGMGDWDRFAVDWLYGAAMKPRRRPRCRRRLPKGYRYVSDSDARSPATAQPWGGLWDDGADPAAELERMIAVRRAAVQNLASAHLPRANPSRTSAASSCRSGFSTATRWKRR
jgi:hypothetical protein